jgi:hypothetical protein
MRAGETLPAYDLEWRCIAALLQTGTGRVA